MRTSSSGTTTNSYNRGKAYLYLGGASVADVAFSLDKSTVTWNGSCNPALFDVVRGSVSDLPDYSRAACLENDSTDTSTPAGSDPSVTSAYYYLVSCHNPKDWDDATQTGTRTITACP